MRENLDTGLDEYKKQKASRPTKRLPKRAFNPAVGARRSARNRGLPPQPEPKSVRDENQNELAPSIASAPLPAAEESSDRSARVVMRIPSFSHTSSEGTTLTRVSRDSAARSDTTLVAEEEQSVSANVKGKGKARAQGRRVRGMKSIDEEAPSAVGLGAAAEEEQSISAYVRGKGKAKAVQAKAPKRAVERAATAPALALAKVEQEENVSAASAAPSASAGLITRRRAKREGVVVKPIYEAQIEAFEEAEEEKKKMGEAH